MMFTKQVRIRARAIGLAVALLITLGTVASAQFGPPPVRSPEVNADSTVTFRLMAPNAKAVSVRGITREPLAMTKDGAGVWTATSASLKPDLYTYSFDVDGLSIVDPSNTRFSSPYRRIGQNTVLVPGDMPWTPLPNVPRGVVAQHVFQSKLANDERDFFVYTPPNYDAKRSEPYPVLYLHHGWQQDTRAWLDDGLANVTLDTLINKGKAVPMVVVMPHAYGTAAGPVDIDHLDMLPTYTRILLEEVIPQVEKQYNVSAEPNGRAMAGLSMGGAESMHTGLNHLETFAWLGSFSGAFNTWPLTRPATRGRGFNRRDGLVCMNMKGEIQWKTRRAPNFNKGSMILVDGVILATDGEKSLYVIELSPQEFKAIQSAELLGEGGGDNSGIAGRIGGPTQNWAPLALSNGKLLIRDQAELKCVKVGQ